MVFKDEAKAMLARWQNLRCSSEADSLAAQTAILIANEDDVPGYVLDALDGLIQDTNQMARRVVDVVRYLQWLADERSVQPRASSPREDEPKPTGTVNEKPADESQGE